jgi:Tropinone reductase 1
MNDDRWNLKGKNALVTGGTKGIGRAIVREFIDLGANVFTVARNEKGLASMIEEMSGSNQIEGLPADVSKRSERIRIINKVKEKWDRLDILVNNVGVNIRKKTPEYSDEEYDHIMDTNLRSAFELCRLAFPLLKKSDQGNIIFVTSTAGLIHIRTGAVYGMTKAALIQLTRNLAAEWAEHNIRVNAVAPWYIETPLVKPVLQDQDYFREVISRTPMKKIGKPADVAGAVSFLCMPAAAYITGHCIPIDGGFIIYGF